MKILIGWCNACSAPLNYIDGLVQKRRNYIADTLELRLSFIDLSISTDDDQDVWWHMSLLPDT